jgi:hypothetical protein
MMPTALGQPPSNIGKINLGLWRALALVPCLIAMSTRGDHIAGNISSTIALGGQVFSSAAKPCCGLCGNARQLLWRAVPHQHTAIPAATTLLLEGLKAKGLDL